METGTAWLTQKQIAELFKTERSVISRHIGKIFREGELPEKSNVQKMHIANSDKPVRYYGPDVTISVGYRVNSKRAARFRGWAANIARRAGRKADALRRRGLAVIVKVPKSG